MSNNAYTLTGSLRQKGLRCRIFHTHRIFTTKYCDVNISHSQEFYNKKYCDVEYFILTGSSQQQKSAMSNISHSQDVYNKNYCNPKCFTLTRSLKQTVRNIFFFFSLIRSLQKKRTAISI